MSTPSLNYIYNRKSAERIFDKEVKKVEIWHNCILVTFDEGSPRFVSKATFKQHFADFRKSSSRQVSVIYDPLIGIFRSVSSRNIQNTYKLELYADHLSCTCADYRTQKELGIKRPMCKHAYAVLDYIGCTSLQDYVSRNGFSFLDTNKTLHQYQDPLQDYHDELMSQENYR